MEHDLAATQVMASLVEQTIKNPPAMQDTWVERREFLPTESHGQRSLAGYSPWGRKESDMTERLTHTHTVKDTHTQS